MSEKFRVTNPLWRYFTKLPGEAKTATCNACSKKLSHRTSITNLKSHLMKKHETIYNAYLKDQRSYYSSVQQSSPPTSSSNQTVYLLPISSTSRQQIKYEISSSELQETEEITEVDNSINDTIETTTTTTTKIWTPEEQKSIDAMLLKMIVQSYQPVSIVEEQHFLELVNTLNENYVLPKREYIVKTILPEFYNKCLDEQKSIIDHEAVTICLTIDRWTSIKMVDLIAITAHFINPNFEFKSVLLKCCQSSDGSEELAEILRETCIEWNILGRIIWCVTDNATDIVQAVDMLGWNHSSCMAYNLNLTLQNALKLCDQTLDKVKTIVHYYQFNCEAEEKLLDYQTRARSLAEPLMLIESEDTNWNSVYFMIERFVALQDAIKATIEEHEDDLPLITNADWSKLKQLCKLLKPFNEATEELVADKYASASKAIAVVNGLKDVLQEIHKKPDFYCFVKDVVKCIEAELTERFHGLESEINLAICTILDPRYKMSMFLDEDAAEIAKSNLVSEIHKVIKDGNGSFDPLKMKSERSRVATEDSGEFSLWRRRNLILEKKTVNSSVSHQRVAEQEVDSYMQDELADGNPYEWWQNNQFKYPNLAKLFRTRCNMVATSVPSEQLFSENGSSLCERRRWLSVKKAEKIVFLNANLKDNDYINFLP